MTAETYRAGLRSLQPTIDMATRALTRAGTETDRSAVRQDLAFGSLELLDVKTRLDTMAPPTSLIKVQALLATGVADESTAAHQMQDALRRGDRKELQRAQIPLRAGMSSFRQAQSSLPAVSTSGGNSTVVVMQGESMMPTLRNGQILVVDWGAYRGRSPRRGDIVVFRAVPAGQPDRIFVKRVVGLPGETVAVVHGSVTINGRRLSEPYIKPAYRAQYRFYPATVPHSEYFVLGDNRNNSFDSHLWKGLPRADIAGKVRLR